MTLKNRFLWIVGILFLFLAVPIKAEAGSAVIQFTTSYSEVEKGEIFTVICQVTSTDTFLDAEFYVEYDAERIRFVSGGGKVTGGNGVLTVSSTGNETSTNKKTFSLQFEALKKGDAVFDVKDTARIRNEDGESFSSSSNRLVVTIIKKGAGKSEIPAVTAAPAVTPEPVLSDKNGLKSLKVNALDLTPTFSSDTESYTARVSHSQDTLYVSFEAEDENARVQLKGNENLKDGDNQVRIIVTAENGDVKTYKVKVTRETEEETQKREAEEKDVDEDIETEPDISFQVSRDQDKILLRNSYEFEVLDPSELSEVPAGYVLSSIEVGGIRVPAFTMQNDLDNNYLLMYLKGPAGQSSIYQYDRAEKTLQRYTGSMISKVNKSAGTDNKESNYTVSNVVLFGIIVGLVIIILCMLITMLKMAMKKRENRAARRHADQRSEGYDEERFYR